MKYSYILLLSFTMMSCSSDISDDSIVALQAKGEPGINGDIGSVITDNKQIVLGKEIPDIYSVEAMRRAYQAIYPNGDGQYGPDVIRTTYQYVRFLPKNEEELHAIEQYNISDIPLHYEITKGGSSYHDPSIPEDKYTWQYAVVPMGTINTTVQYEVIKNLFLEEETSTGSGDIGTPGTPGAQGPTGSVERSFWETLEIASERIVAGKSANDGQQGAPAAARWRPKGLIQAYDDKLKQYVPLQGVHVIIWHNYVRHSEVITDANGRFTADKTFKAGYGLYYRIKWTGGKDYTIYDGPFFDQAYLCVGGMIWSDIWSPKIDETSYVQKQLAAMFRAGERAFRGNKNYLEMKRPNFKNQIVLRYYNASNPDKSGSFRGCFSLSNLFPALKVWGKYDANQQYLTSDEMFNTVSHELGHATHYKEISGIRGLGYVLASDNFSESWAEAVAYFITKQEYAELGLDIDRHRYLSSPSPPPVGENGKPRANSIPAGQYSTTGPNYYVIPSDLNKQYWPYSDASITKGNVSAYSSLIIDLIDDNNQREYYKRLGKSNYSGLPQDEVEGFTLAEIQGALGDLINISGFRAKAKALNKKHAKPNTDLEIDDLFNSHTRYW